MNPLMQLIPRSAQDSIPILHPESCSGQGVMLGNGDVDDFVDIEVRLEHLPAGQHLTLQIDLFESRGIGENHFSSRILRGGSNSGGLETSPRLVAAHVRHNDSFGS